MAVTRVQSVNTILIHHVHLLVGQGIDRLLGIHHIVRGKEAV